MNRRCQWRRINATQVECVVCGRMAKFSGDESTLRASCQDLAGDTLDLACVHRGAELRMVDCGCGQRGEQRAVFACDLFGECVERRAKAGDGLRACLTCAKRRAPL